MSLYHDHGTHCPAYSAYGRHMAQLTRRERWPPWGRTQPPRQPKKSTENGKWKQGLGHVLLLAISGNCSHWKQQSGGLTAYCHLLLTIFQTPASQNNDSLGLCVCSFKHYEKWGLRVKNNQFQASRWIFLFSFFTMAVISHWHRLPREVLGPSSLKAFKSKPNVLLEYIVNLEAGCGFQRRS